MGAAPRALGGSSGGLASATHCAPPQGPTPRLGAVPSSAREGPGGLASDLLLEALFDSAGGAGAPAEGREGETEPRRRRGGRRETGRAG